MSRKKHLFDLENVEVMPGAIPPRAQREGLQPGDHAKLLFLFLDGTKEHLWVRVKSRRTAGGYLAVLASVSAAGKLHNTVQVTFHPEHVVSIISERE